VRRVFPGKAACRRLSDVGARRVDSFGRAFRILVGRSFEIRAEIPDEVRIRWLFAIFKGKLRKGRIHLAKVFNAPVSLGSGAGMNKIRDSNRAEHADYQNYNHEFYQCKAARIGKTSAFRLMLVHTT